MTTATDKAQEQIIETLELVQERLIETNQRIVASLNELLPNEVKERMAKVPRPDIDLPDLPEPRAAVESAFDFVDRVAKSNRDLADKLVNIWAPTSPTAEKAEEKTTETPAKADATTTAKKAPAKKAATKKTVAKKATAKKTVAKKATAKKTD